MEVKIAREHNIGDKLQIGNAMFKINKYYNGCEECDLQPFNICRKVACNPWDRLDDNSIAFSLVKMIQTPYDRD